MGDHVVSAMTTTRPVLVAILIVIPLVAVPAGAVDQRACNLDAIETDPLVDAYNENLDRIPGFLRDQTHNQVIDLYVNGTDGSHRYVVRTDDEGTITQFEDGVASTPTLEVETNGATACEILLAEDPATVARQAYSDGEIEISGATLSDTIKVFLARIIHTIVEFVSGLI